MCRCTFCGITMHKYVEGRFSVKSQTTIKYVLKMISSVSETVIFMYLGISAVNVDHVWNTAFILLTVVFCLVFRSIGMQSVGLLRAGTLGLCTTLAVYACICYNLCCIGDTLIIWVQDCMM
jgi:NhaP-type Na+/H+ or K+/H+ antiporter